MQALSSRVKWRSRVQQRLFETTLRRSGYRRDVVRLMDFVFCEILAEDA